MTDYERYDGDTHERIFDAETYRAARRAWDDGEFGREWQDARHLCWEMGYPFPPSGNPGDDEGTSQRAIVWRALDDRPISTLNIIRRARSWSEVVLLIFEEKDEIRYDISERELDDQELRKVERREWSYREGLLSLKRILDRIHDS